MANKSSGAEMPINPFSVHPPREKMEITNDDIMEKYFEAMIMSGQDVMDDSSYLRLYNSLHRLDYFNPHVASGLHIFITRPFCAFTANNLTMDPSLALAASSFEGCLLLGSLMPPYGMFLGPLSDDGYNNQSPEDLVSKWDGIVGVGESKSNYGKALWQNVRTHGLNQLRGTPFIPLLSNLSTSISGMQDFVMEKYDYDGDQAGNKTSDAKGMDESTSSGQVTITYDETSNLDILMMHYLWMMYMDKTGKGIMVPSMKSIVELYYDYMASIYWFVTGPDGMSIKIYGKLTGVFPINLPATALIPSKRGTPADPSMTITYHYNHAEIMNPEIIWDFNHTIQYMKDQLPQERLENDVMTFNNELMKFRKNNFVITWEKAEKDLETQIKNNKYSRLMSTGINPDTKKPKYEHGIFYPDVQNQWVAHPWVYEGKLVYRSF